MVVVSNLLQRFMQRCLLASIDENRFLAILGVCLTTLDIFQPTVGGDIVHGGSFAWVGVEHGKEDAAECWRIDECVEERYVWVVSFVDAAFVGVSGIPILPTAYQTVVDC